MEGDSRGNIEKLNTKASNVEHDDSLIFQSTWIQKATTLDNKPSIAESFQRKGK